MEPTAGCCTSTFNLLRVGNSYKIVSDANKNCSTVIPMEPTAGGCTSTFTTNIPAITTTAVSHRISESSRRFQHLLDKMMPYLLYRWIAFLCIALTYAVRVYLVGGFYGVSYALGIYLLNLVIEFISPLEDPELSDGLTLHIQSSDEFHPFVRRLPEFKFWCSIATAFSIAILLTCFSIFDVPVFWPILLIYWIALCGVTLRKQIQHMIKYKYVPFTFGKQRYDGKKESPGEIGERKVAPLV